ncbi:MAG: low-specificity L-threonine aldolase [Chloroflexi bacterium]|nr:low-specificity L-threonine aldolase [Chloroflexota bacterium]
MNEPVKVIDLRSDTVTQPTPAMREAMYRAEVGDDVFGEDPSVNRLEALAAEMLGKEAGLFVASGTMGNLVSFLTHCRRGDEVIIGDQAHSFTMEVGGASALGGAQFRPLPNQPDGTLDLLDIQAALRPANIHYPPTRLICLENTHNRTGGRVLSREYVAAVRQIADRHGLAIHLDGARIFNAAVALGLDVKELTLNADSVQFCLSKGLAAPVGSLIVGSREFIQQARKNRKMVGGGMRQAGVIAAAGIVALTQMVDRLAEDHANAKLLAQGLADTPGIEIDPENVQTNIVIFSLARGDMTPQELENQLKERGVWLFAIGGRRLRAVTHYEILREDILTALAVFCEILN